jgi:hypothetical protein
MSRRIKKLERIMHPTCQQVSTLRRLRKEIAIIIALL